MSNPLNGHSVALMAYELAEALDESGEYPTPTIWRSSPVTTIQHNYDDLLIPEDAVCRSPKHTHYLEGDQLLRTHTSELMPRLLSNLTGEHLLLHPGICYRRDVRDKTHVGEPHQIEIWLLSRDRLGPNELNQLIENTIGSILNLPYRKNNTSHPYTTNGIEIEALYKGEWIEVGECGLTRQELLPEGHYGLAMGLGLDRLVMLRKGIEDIRLLRSSNPEIAQQMTNLDPYQEVSRYPTMSRDLSLTAENSTTIEDLTEQILNLLGSESELIQSIELLAETPYEELPDAAIARLGIQPGEKNVLIRIILQHPSRTLTAAEVNRLRNHLLQNLD